MTETNRLTPLVSIVIPLYNRAAFIERALTSCVRQSFAAWEAVVVDDGSSDGSREVVNRFSDSRVKLVVHESNRGRGAARNSGARESSANWLLFLDSDDELLEGALNTIWAHCASAPERVAKLLFACRWDDGTVSPDPPFEETDLDYEGFIRWLERMHGRPSEAIPAVRRDAFLQVPYPERRTPEGSHNLDFAHCFASIGYPHLVRLYHLDAGNRVMDAVRSIDGLMAEAPGVAWVADAVIEAHGDALRHWAPRVYQDYLQTGGLYHLIAGDRTRGVTMAVRAWLNRPGSLRALGVLACAWMPGRTLARLKTRLGR